MSSESMHSSSKVQSPKSMYSPLLPRQGCMPEPQRSLGVQSRERKGGRRSTLGPRFLGGNCGFPHQNRQPWVPATSFLFCVRWATRPNCQPLTLSHLESDGGPTNSMPSAARPHCILPARNLETLTIFKNSSQIENALFDETMGGSPVISCEGLKMLQRTRVRQVFRRGII
jgi:hypothetical protein